METIAQAVIAVAWLAIVALLLWGSVEGLRRLLKDEGPLPLFAMLDRQGVTLRQVEEVAGMQEMARAARRCALCASRSDCDGHAAWCPNEALLRRAKGEGGTP